ncbi:hypothetical protein Pres01_25940 [Metapseudomonas resinovorans]|uniref:WD40/YVTN/BNR-like repeat-containing protein n=1 Tax=Metapseudomonas resinovorans TaxID=53412 RepID=UPI00098663DD|nr:YCF48-related protein [Pseudomonas resinovorans]GLZ86543.1 hypothetical protein Pres01_25940 [Pseudomonas resinovorans]
MFAIHSLRLLLAALILASGGSPHAEEGAEPAMPLAAPQHAPLVAVTLAGERLAAVGGHGVVVLSDDGQAWRQAKSVPVDGLLTAVSFADAQHGWAVGHGGVLLLSEDGGETWTRQADLEGLPVLLSVWFENPWHGFVTGAYGYAAQTRDGGNSWQRLRVGAEGDDYHLNQVFPGPNGSLFIVAEMGNAFRSRDGGSSWETLDTGASGSLWTGLGLRDGRVLLAGMSGRVLLSDDQGDSWRELDSGSHEAITSLAQLPDGRVALVGNGGLVGLSDPGVGRFTATIREDRLNLAALAPQAGGDLLLFGPSGVLLQENGTRPQP